MSEAPKCRIYVGQVLIRIPTDSYIVGRTEEKLETVAEAHGKNISGQIIPIVGDISTKDGVQ